MLKPLRYVFYRTLSWRRKHGRDRAAILEASISVSFLLFLNALLVGEIFITRSGRAWPIIHRDFPTYLGASGAFFLMYVAMYFAWVANGKVGNLQREFDAPSPGRQKARSLLFWSYVILSAITPIAFAVVVGMKRGA